MTTIVIEMKMRPEKSRELRITLTELSDELKTQHGFLNAHIHNSPVNPEELTFFEVWETKRDCDAYIRSEAFSVLKGALKVLTDSASVEVSDGNKVFNRKPP